MPLQLDAEIFANRYTCVHCTAELDVVIQRIVSCEGIKKFPAMAQQTEGWRPLAHTFSTEASNQTDHCNAGMLSPGAISAVLVRFSNPLASEAGNLAREDTALLKRIAMHWFAI